MTGKSLPEFRSNGSQPLVLFITFLFFFFLTLNFMLRLLLLVLLLRLRLVLHTRVRLLWFRLVLHTRVLLLWLRLVLHTRVRLLWLRLVLHTRVQPFRGHLTRTWFASFGVGWSSGAALESFLPPTALATMVLLIKFLIIMLALPVFMPIRIPPMKTLPVLRLHLIPRKPSRTIPGFGSVNIAGIISVIWGPTVIRTVKIVQDTIQKPITVVIDPRRIRPHPG